MGDRSGHSESGEPRLLTRTRLRRALAMEEGDGGQVEFGSAGGGPGGPNRMYFSFIIFLFLLSGGYGEKEIG